LPEDFKKPLWLARETASQHLIVIKFTRRYNETAHGICAKLQLSPQLLHAGNMQYGFRMIVMEHVDGSPLTDNKIDKIAKDSKASNAIFNDVQQAINALHGQNIVFADLRQPNILVVKTKTPRMTKLRAKLVDFDWCGTHNVHTYPLMMNTQITWPDGAGPDALLMQAHDLAWLQILKAKLKL
jgi:serine/threonine protein kinase